MPEFATAGRAEIAAIVVTYGSAECLGALLDDLRAQAEHLSLRVVVADNSPDGDTLAVARSHADVIAVPTGGNLGYAGGVNVALAHVGDAEAIAVLNPDLRVRPGALRTLLDELRAVPRPKARPTGVVVPRIVDETGATSTSLFREPSATRALGDALLGPLWPSRPGWLSEVVRTPSAYQSPREVDWATGAALLLSADAARAVGAWDERFFLYSEETDILRRVREAGFAVRYTPHAVVEHSQGGSGSSPALDALLEANRVRYLRKHAPRQAAAYRAALVLGAALRRRRAAVTALRDERSWPSLPEASWRGSGSPAAAIVIPACNEAAVIERTLARIAEPAAAGSLEVVVVANGCSDDTAERARGFAGVRVLELSVGSKTTAISAGLVATSARPVLVLDADVELPSAAIPGLVRALAEPGAVAGRPPFAYDLREASPLVRAYHRARLRIPGMSRALWGAGVYALTPEGVARALPLPAVTADDVWVDRLVAPDEKRIPPVPPVRVRVPRSARALLHTLVRVRRGPAELGVDTGRGTLRALVRTATTPSAAWDAAVYAGFAIAARRRVRRGTSGAWERDASARTAAA